MVNYQRLLRECVPQYGPALGERIERYIEAPWHLSDSRWNLIHHVFWSQHGVIKKLDALGLAYYLLDFWFSEELPWWSEEFSETYLRLWQELHSGLAIDLYEDTNPRTWVVHAIEDMEPVPELETFYDIAVASFVPAMDALRNLEDLSPRTDLLIRALSAVVTDLSAVYANPYGKNFWNRLGEPEETIEEATWTPEMTNRARDFLNRWEELVLCMSPPQHLD